MILVCLLVLIMEAEALELVVFGRQGRCFNLHLPLNDTLVDVEINARLQVEATVKKTASSEFQSLASKTKLTVQLDDGAVFCFRNTLPLEETISFNLYPTTERELRSIATSGQLRQIRKLLTETNEKLNQTRQVLEKRTLRVLQNRTKSAERLLWTLFQDLLYSSAACLTIVLVQVVVFVWSTYKKSKSDKQS